MSKLSNIKAIVDLETGGFSKTKNAVCEVGIIFIDENNIEIEKYGTLIKPYFRPSEEGVEDELCSYKEDAMKVNGIKISDLEKNGQDIIDVVNDIKILCKEFECNTMIAHNSSFDESFLNVLFDRFGNGFRFKFVECTQKLAKGKLKLPSYSLANLCSYFGIINKNQHRSLGDCQATLELLIELESL
jgi:DNA polymerase III epsilon subunit-like protein